MARLLLVLLLTVSFGSSYLVRILMDPTACVHLLCEWRGSGKHCKNDAGFLQLNQQKTWSNANQIFPLRRKNEPEASVLARIKAEYPVNTFTVVNDFDYFEQCEQIQLWCNTPMYTFTDHSNINLKRPTRTTTQPRLDC